MHVKVINKINNCIVTLKELGKDLDLTSLDLKYLVPRFKGGKVVAIDLNYRMGDTPMYYLNCFQFYLLSKVEFAVQEIMSGLTEWQMLSCSMLEKEEFITSSAPISKPIFKLLFCWLIDNRMVEEAAAIYNNFYGYFEVPELIFLMDHLSKDTDPKDLFGCEFMDEYTWEKVVAAVQKVKGGIPNYKILESLMLERMILVSSCTNKRSNKEELVWEKFVFTDRHSVSIEDLIFK